MDSLLLIILPSPCIAESTHLFSIHPGIYSSFQLSLQCTVAGPSDSDIDVIPVL